MSFPVIRIAVAGAGGFIGGNLIGEINRTANLEAVPIPRSAFSSSAELRSAMEGCHALMMLAGVSRSDHPEELYAVNLKLAATLAEAASRMNGDFRVVFGSTTHINKESLYHASKRDSAALLEKAAAEHHFELVTALMPNTFGPFGKPFYNSVVSTFCYSAANQLPLSVSPEAGSVKLIWVGTLCRHLIGLLTEPGKTGTVVIPDEFEIPVAEIAAKLEDFAAGTGCGDDEFSMRLHQTFCWYKKRGIWR